MHSLTRNASVSTRSSQRVCPHLWTQTTEARTESLLSSPAACCLTQRPEKQIVSWVSLKRSFHNFSYHREAHQTSKRDLPRENYLVLGARLSLSSTILHQIEHLSGDHRIMPIMDDTLSFRNLLKGVGRLCPTASGTSSTNHLLFHVGDL